MKKKASEKRDKIRSKKVPIEAQPLAVSRSTPEAPTAPGNVTLSPPPPEVVFREAEEEPDCRTLGAYLDAIRVLREKSFSYREIANWLSERGVDADHNAVYRVYTKSLSDYEAHLEAEREDSEALEEALRNRSRITNQAINCCESAKLPRDLRALIARLSARQAPVT